MKFPVLELHNRFCEELSLPAFSSIQNAYIIKDDKKSPEKEEMDEDMEEKEKEQENIDELDQKMEVDEEKLNRIQKQQQKDIILQKNPERWISLRLITLLSNSQPFFDAYLAIKKQYLLVVKQIDTFHFLYDKELQRKFHILKDMCDSLKQVSSQKSLLLSRIHEVSLKQQEKLATISQQQTANNGNNTSEKSSTQKLVVQRSFQTDFLDMCNSVLEAIEKFQTDYVQTTEWSHNKEVEMKPFQKLINEEINPKIMSFQKFISAVQIQRDEMKRLSEQQDLFEKQKKAKISSKQISKKQPSFQED